MKGLAGWYSSTCLPAAIDYQSQELEFPLWFYHYYNTAFKEQQRYGPDKTRTITVYQTMLQLMLGNKYLKQVTFKRARNQIDATRILDGARVGGYRIVLVVEALHVVGLQPLPNGRWRMVGNGLPTYQTLTTHEVFPFLYQPKKGKDKRKRKQHFNIYIFPPDPKK